MDNGMDGSSVRAAVETIHRGTAIYTARAEIDRLLDETGWPDRGGDLLDPACGDGNMVVAALARLAPAPGDLVAASRIHGIEFHEASAETARRRVVELLTELGWEAAQAARAATRMIETRDFLLDRTGSRRWNVILANPPYWRRTNLPAAYRLALDAAAPRGVTGDLLHAYLHRMIEVVADGGIMGLVTSDRWLLNDGASAVRKMVGAAFRVGTVRRLDPASAFHRPKERSRGTPPRVHAVAMTLGTTGRAMTGEPFRIEPLPHVEGVPLGDLVEIRLAPWLGPDGIFTVKGGSGLPEEFLVPCVEPRDIDVSTGTIGEPRRWAIVTGERRPPEPVMAHLERELPRMPPRGRKRIPWQPPERFTGQLPLERESVLVPRISLGLRAVRLPAGMLPTNHSLVVVSGMDAGRIVDILGDERVRRQADALALKVESGYASYTATLLRRLVIPHDLIEEEPERKAA